MTEFRAKKMQKITARIQGLIEELELLIDAELRHVGEYGACEDLCRSMSDADQLMRRAVYKMQEAAAFAELEEILPTLTETIEGFF